MLKLPNITFDIKENENLKKLILNLLPIILIISLAIIVRIYLPWWATVKEDIVKIAADDAPYHLRLVENTLKNFPDRIFYDPFTFYQIKDASYIAPLFTWLASLMALGIQFFIYGSGEPTRHSIELGSALIPAIGGVIIILLCYLIALQVFKQKTIALLSALILVFMPGQFLSRTLLGFADHHVLEILFSCLTFYFYLLSLKYNQPTKIINDENGTPKLNLKPLILYSFLGGISLSLFILSWVGATFLFPIILFFFLIQSSVNHFHKVSNKGLALSTTILLLLPLFTSLALSRIDGLASYILTSLTLPIIVFILGIIFLLAISNLLHFLKQPPRTYPLLITILFLSGILLINYLNNNFDFLKTTFHGFFHIFLPTGQATTIAEARPLFLNQGRFSLNMAWGYFTTTLFFALVAFFPLTLLTIKNKADYLFFLIWSSYMYVAVTFQNRFAYFFAFNVAILSGYLGYKLINLVNYLVSLYTEKNPDGSLVQYKKVSKFIIWVIMLMILIYPNSLITIETASAGMGIHPEWYRALVWLKDNSPQPSLDYYETYKLPKNGEYSYPSDHYTIMSWWDFGYQIAYYGKRTPVANPGGHGTGGYIPIKYQDLNEDGKYTENEPIVLDNDNNNLISKRDVLIFNKVSPDQKVILTSFSSQYLYFDSNNNLKFDSLDTLIYDEKVNLKWDGSGKIFFGKEPEIGSNLKFLSLNPGVAPFLITTDLNTAKALLKNLHTRYIITSLSMATQKYWAIATLGMGNLNRYFENYFVEKMTLDGISLRQEQYYYPEYYKTMLSRLYFFKGEEVVPQNSTWVIRFDIREDRGVKYKIVKEEWLFSNYEEAREFLKDKESTKYQLVGKSPNISPVPLEKLDNIKLVYDTSGKVFNYLDDGKNLKGLVIFEYLDK